MCIIVTLFINIPYNATNVFPDEYKNIHPRLFTNDEGIAKAKVLAESNYADIYASLKNYVDNLISEDWSGYEYYVDSSNEEDAWMRRIADDLIKIAYMYKMIDDKKYLTLLLYIKVK